MNFRALIGGTIGTSWERGYPAVILNRAYLVLIQQEIPSTRGYSGSLHFGIYRSRSPLVGA